jgi:hypothetical protein
VRENTTYNSKEPTNKTYRTRRQLVTEKSMSVEKAVVTCQKYQFSENKKIGLFHPK